MKQTIFIGDIHGCSREFSRLLSKVAPASSDHIVLMGDLINKGPDPVGVLRMVESLDCFCLRGNHESDHLKWHEEGRAPKRDSELTREQMTPAEYEEFLHLAALTSLFLDEEDFLAVHGYLLPDTPLLEQPEDILTGERTLENSWKNKVDLGRPLVVGHKRYSENQKEPFIIEGKFYGLDTGCVYGGCLTALALPSGQIWQTRAARDYTGRGL